MKNKTPEILIFIFALVNLAVVVVWQFGDSMEKPPLVSATLSIILFIVLYDSINRHNFIHSKPKSGNRFTVTGYLKKLKK